MTGTRQATPDTSRRTALRILLGFMFGAAAFCVYGAFAALEQADRSAAAMTRLSGRYYPSEFPAGSVTAMVVIGAAALGFAVWIIAELRKS